MSEPRTFAALLEAQTERRREFQDRIGGRRPANGDEAPAAPDAQDAEGGGLSDESAAPLGKLSDEERALIEAKAAKGDPLALDIVEGLEAEARPAAQAGDAGAKRSPRGPKSAASAFNDWTRKAVADRRSMAARSGVSTVGLRGRKN